MKMQVLTFCIPFVLAFTAFGTEYYVQPGSDDGSSCQFDNCRNLSIYVANIDEYFKDDTIFYFLDGTHILDSSILIEITSVNNLTFQAVGNQIEQTDYDTLMISTTRIDCSSFEGGFSFINSSNIILNGLSFIGCGGSAYIPISFDYALVSLVFDSVFNVTLRSLAVVNTTGFGVALTNCFDISIVDSSFGMNRITQECLNSEAVCSGGNVVIHYYETLEMELYDLASVTISRSNFTRGFSSTPSLGGGITLLYQIPTKLSVVYDRLVAYGNSGIVGANYNFEIITNANYTFVVTDVMGLDGNRFDTFPSSITDIIQIVGAGFRLIDITLHGDSETKYASVQILNSEFSNGFANSFGGLSFSWNVNNVENINVIIENCTFVNNTANEGAALYGFASRSFFSQNLYIVLKNLHFENNRAYKDDDEYNTGVLLQNLYIEAENVTVINTELTGMILIDSVMSISGNMTYINNSDTTNGGALGLYESSALLFNPPFYCSFINNTADRRGGGIYIDFTFTGLNEDCFYQYAPGANQSAESVLYFEGNVAGIAGDILYGGNIIGCSSGLTFTSVFQYPNQTGISVISSSPMTVCFCTNESIPDCGLDATSISIAPGQTFYMQLVIVGQEHGAVPGVVRITDATNEPSITVLRNLAVACNNISYSIELKNTTQVMSTLYLLLQREKDPLILDNAKILNISISPCPVGFELNTETGRCTCIGELRSIKSVICDVTTEQMSREGSVWMGYDEIKNCTIVREDCPYDYCLSDNVTFHITRPDPQCAMNRAGTMCGACAEGYSLMLGTNKCGKCTNVSLLLILVFFLAGIVIVGLITALNMTLSLGTINGLIFYGNIIKINEEVFFPKGPIPIISQFISWINLDFGIESCFYDGMTALGKAWLQFVFPLYLWVLVIVIIVLARYSKLLAKLLGNNSVPVLATLVLLSYAKLFRAIIYALIGTRIYCGLSSQTMAWYVDPNIAYNDPSHFSLVVLAGIFLFGAALPYTFILLVNQFIIVCLASNLCIKVGCNRIRLSIRLFFDAYNAPYTSRARGWTGFLLLVRFISVLVISLQSNNNEVVSTTLMLVIVLSIFAISGGVYAKKYLNYLEVWFLFNLLFLVSVVSLDDTSTQVAAAISTTLIIITFIGIIMFHCWLKLENTKFGNKVKALFSKFNFSKKKTEKSDMDEMVSKEYSVNAVRSTSIGVDVRRRETLLHPLVESSSYNNARVTTPVTV